MRIVKKGIALILVLTFVFGMMPVASMADDEPSILLKPTDQFVKAGDSFKVQVFLKAGSSAMSVAGIELYFTYDDSKVSVAVDQSTYSYFSKEGKVNQWSLETGVETKGLVVVAGATANKLVYLTPNPDEEILLGSLNFQAIDDVVPGTMEFGLNQDFSEGNKYGLSSDKANIITSPDNINYDVDFSQTTSVSIVSTGVNLSQNEVTVDATNDVKVQAYAFNTAVEDVTKNVAWSVIPADGGVSITSDGTITINAKAKAGYYDVTATSSEAFGDAGKAIATLWVSRTQSEAVSVDVSPLVSYIEPTMYVPTEEPSTRQFEVTVTDQYGDELEHPEVKWSISPACQGVSIAEDATRCGAVTVTNAAKNEITDTEGEEFTVTAKCGEVQASTTITIKRAEAYAASVVIYRDGNVVTSNDTIAIPQSGSTEVEYSAKVLDQYGSEIKDPLVTWSSSGDTPDGVTVTGKSVAVPSDASTGSFTLTATYSDGVEASLTVNVVTIAFSVQDAAVTTATNPTYGMTWGEIVNINDSKISANVGGQPVEGTYSVKDAATIPDAGKDVEYQVLFTSNDGSYTDYVAYTGKVDIAPKSVTVSGITAENKVYNGSTDATLATDGATISGIVDDDDVTIDITSATGTFEDENVGTGKTVTISGIALDGADKDNYKLTSDSATTTANITAKAVTVSGITAENKEYDGTTNATLNYQNATFDGKCSGDALNVASATGTFADEDAGAGKTVTITGITLGGYDAGNYTLSNTTATATANITPSRSITDATNKTQNVVVGVGAFTEPKFTGVNGEEVTGTVTYSYDGATSYGDIVEKLQSLNKDDTATIRYTFAANGNYAGTISGDINVTMVDIVFTVGTETATADNAVTIKEDPTYGDTWSSIVTINDNIAATLNGITVSGYYKLEETGTPKAGTQSFTLQFVSNDKTYDVFTGTVHIEKLELGFSAVVNEKAYDGNNTATVERTTLTGRLYGDDVDVDWTSAAFDNKNAGTDKQVTISGITLAGSDKDNYTIDGTYTTTASITPKSVTITGVTAEDKPYDGSTAAEVNISGASIVGVIDSDTVTIQPGTGIFASADVGTDITVTFSGFQLTGTDSGNYTLQAQPENTTANIIKADYTGTPNTVNVNILINQDAAQTGSVSIDQFFQTVPAGAVITSVASASGSVMNSVTVEGGVIKYSSNANLETAGVTDAYTVTIETQNYNDIEATLTFTTVAKTPVNISGVSVTGAGKTYDGKAVSYTGTPVAKTNDGTTVEATGTYSYVWQKADGTVLVSAPKDAGSYKLVITLDDDPAYIGSAEVSFTIAKATITVTANDAEAYVGEDMPEFTYTVSGLVPGEALATNPTVTCSGDMDEPGEYVITVCGAVVPATGNYNETIEYTNGTLTVSRRPVNVGPTYGIEIEDQANGTIKASLGNASEGSVITLTVTPDKGYRLGSLYVYDENGDEISVRKSGSEYKFTMPDGEVTVVARFVPDIDELPFDDVNTGDWFYDYVEYVYDNGIMDGVADGVFSPDTATTRGMVVTILYRLYGEPVVRGDNSFTDVASGAYYADAITWASNAGIVNGTSATTFSPNDLVTREQFAAMLYRYMTYIGEDVSARAYLSRYTDSGSISTYAESAMSWAVAEGILNGRTATTLAPSGNCTRAEVAAMITRVFG